MNISNIIPSLESKDSQDYDLGLELLCNFEDEVKNLSFVESKKLIRILFNLIEKKRLLYIPKLRKNNIYVTTTNPYRFITDLQNRSKHYSQPRSDFDVFHGLNVHNKILHLIKKLKEVYEFSRLGTNDLV